MARVTQPHVIFWALIANSSRIVKVTDSKFGVHIPRDCVDTPLNFFENGAWPGSRDRLIIHLAEICVLML